MPKLQDFFTINAQSFSPYTPEERVQILYAAKAKLMQQIKLAERAVGAVTDAEKQALWQQYIADAAENPDILETQDDEPA